MKDKPTGNVTFLFTDIEGSTRLAQDFPESLSAALEKHHVIMHKAAESNNGFVFEIVGDAFCCAFQNAEDAVRAAVDAQINLADEKWDDVRIKIRIGIHSGNAEWNGKRYMGYITLARTARVMSSAYGEQIIISNDTYELAKEKIPNKISLRDLGERRLKDLKQPVRLFQVASDGLREDFPPLKTLDARPNNLPVQLTSFIGREAEMKRVKELLKQTHLLTLTGSGGEGKTRLSLQIAADVVDDFVNGVWFVELASLFEPALIPQAIMKVFGIKEEPKRSLEETLCDYLKDKEMLIILDNCEHLIDACAKLTKKLLSISPKLKILATSREELKCEGEQTHRVFSLEVPDPKDKDSPEALSQFEAVRLFIERALAVDSTFRVNNNNAPALAEICFQLDGIPLAIELAAARTKVLTVEQIYERLNDRFNLFTGGKRTALPRQQTLRALIDWSYDLLSEKEKILWARLSVFGGGWTLEAAEIVCSDEKIKNEDIVDLLNSLTEKSIIIYERGKERFGMLETIRQYIGDLNAGKEQKIRQQYFNYFFQLAEKAESELKGSFQDKGFKIFESELPNFQSILLSSLDEVNIGQNMKFIIFLSRFWFLKGCFKEGLFRTKELLGNNEMIPSNELGKLLNWAGKFESESGNLVKAEEFHKQSLSIQKDLCNKKGIAESLNCLAKIAIDRGENENAIKLIQESKSYYYDLGDEKSIVLLNSNLGNAFFNLGELQKAAYYFEKHLVSFRKIGEAYNIGLGINNLANVYVELKEFEKAKELFEEGLILSRETNNSYILACTYFNLGMMQLDQQYYPDAQKNIEESSKLFRESGDKQRLSHCLNSLGNIENNLGNLKQAQKNFEESLILGLENGNRNIVITNILSLVEILIARNHLSKAIILFGAAKTVLVSLIEVDDIYIFNLEEKIYNELSSKISNEEFSKYFEEGKILTLEQAIELMLSSVQ